ncbi:hypothetical protein LX15_000087 [Streptoalloteichus tenebrarius]|uniref:Uncharacterized protein n=1 Tax=Streptoalloteichus tenebrarius (strain ATCC 17920 / DSM 40477 / JCM 4838 / CBS 697.72 / NBRC 16177 / NCIMB 11028 / NRRL B-12390 / A12253. 1 / ISP 5477) TaxID=1933 RepID=A0ABT1HLP1_STRSD|nr:hypothetical protein [Streptoalloteichus tenebrarius]MCP2256404.1 hypothetical protein [Streptoalloteichus tenebrarius]BFF04752.1 hypothetical protein GCM10020241_64270 [Streptoalloteichus tenebrarius]
MAERFLVEPVAEHEYLVRTEAEGQTVECRFHVDPGVLEKLGVAEADEQRVVEKSAVFLAQRQPVIDFPWLVDLQDFLVSYDDYPEELRRLLA